MNTSEGSIPTSLTIASRENPLQDLRVSDAGVSAPIHLASSLVTLGMRSLEAQVPVGVTGIRLKQSVSMYFERASSLSRSFHSKRESDFL